MIERVSLPDKEVVLVGTAHVSRESVEEVEQVIAEEQPDTVCVELDDRRFEAVTEEEKWKQLDIRDALREGKGAVLLVNILLSIYQRRMGDALDIEPGAEMVAAIEAAQAADVELQLIDRDIHDTMQDLVQSLNWREKLRLTVALSAAVLGDEDVGNEQVEELKQQDMLAAMVEELGGQFPHLKTVLIDKRDAHMANRLLDVDGETVVAVVGAAHVNGIVAALRAGKREPVPRPEKQGFGMLRAVQYGVPGIIAAMFLYILAVKGVAIAGEAALIWFLLNGSFAALGAIIARAHIGTVLISFLTAPFTSLNPILPAGLVASYAEHRFNPPTVGDLEKIGTVTTYSAFWSNSALNLLLIFILVNIGSAVATYLGGGYLAQIVF